MIEDLHDALSRPPLMLTTERLWSAYARVQASKVKGADTRRQLTDLVALVRFALGLDDELRPFADSVDKRFQEWIFRHNAKRTTAFTPAVALATKTRSSDSALRNLPSSSRAESIRSGRSRQRNCTGCRSMRARHSAWASSTARGQAPKLP